MDPACGQPKPLSVVVSYSHKDEEHRRALKGVLSTLERQQLVDLWSDHRISPGADIDVEILKALGSADIVLLLVSYDFIASDYCYLRELSLALARHDEGASVVIPLIVRPCDWESLPFGRFKALPTDGVAITAWQNQDSAWLDVSKSLRSLIEEQHQRKRGGAGGHHIRSVRDHLRDEFSRLAKRYESPEELPASAISVGLKELDAVLDGIHLGDIVVFSGRPNMGHHDMALGCAIHVALKQKVPVLYISPRDSGSQIMRRSISAVGRVSWRRLTDGTLTEDDWPRVSNAIAILSEAKIDIDEFGMSGATPLPSRIESRLQKNDVRLIVIEGVDYFATETAEASALVRGLTELCKRYDVSIVCSLTVAPGPEKRWDKRPLIEDLNAWHCLEEEADQIAFFYRDEVYNSNSHHPGRVEILVVKNRHGSTGTVVAAYQESYCQVDGYRIVDASKGWE